MVPILPIEVRTFLPIEVRTFLPVVLKCTHSHCYKSAKLCPYDNVLFCPDVCSLFLYRDKQLCFTLPYSTFLYLTVSHHLIHFTLLCMSRLGL